MPEVWLQGRGAVASLGWGRPDIVAGLRAVACPPGRAPWESVTAQDRLPYYGVDGPHADRCQAMMDAAVREALAEAGLEGKPLDGVALFLGSSSMRLADSEARLQAALAEENAAVPLLACGGMGAMADDLARHFGLGGARYSFSTACTSSLNALIQAVRAVRAGLVERALVVGIECGNRLTLEGFASLLLLAPERCRPFDLRREGMILGEGAAAVLVGTAPAGSGFRYLGGAGLCDPASVTGSTPEGVQLVMREALHEAGLAAGEVTAIKGHGTGTPGNDEAEGQGMAALFGGAMPPLTGLKSRLGHTLGASGLLELVCMSWAVESGFLPATADFREPDPSVGCTPVAQAAPVATGSFMCNCFGFGGNNCSVILSNKQAQP